ncbi:MAG: hypothetical protein J0L75_10225 [Spirochaetes bacterium]|nr:hypothetical protein [Spirochaetota bacterium]
MIVFDETPDLETHLASPLWRRIIPVTGACGGSGKTTVAAALAVALAGQGLRVHAVDLCGAEAALHLALGEPLHRPGLGAALRGAASWEAASHPTRFPGLSLIPADRLEESPSLAPPAARQKLTELLTTLPADAVVLDLGSGTTALAREILLASPHPLVVGLASAADAAATHAILRGALLGLMARYFPQDIAPAEGQGALPTLAALIEKYKAADSRRTFRFLAALERYTPQLLLNRLGDLSELEWLRRLGEHLAERSLIHAVPAGGLPACQDFATDRRVPPVLDRLAKSYLVKLGSRQQRPRPLAPRTAVKIPA